MPLTIPPELKKITPYVRRAEELDRDKGNPESRLVAYYCRQFAVHTGIALATSADGKGCLGELLRNMEGEKAAMDTFTRDESKFLCQKFAEKIFDKADQEDRSGGSNRNTARTFYAAASFLEILQQFYQDDDGSEELAEQKKKSVYCKWKATEILKAIKEGRTPTPGGYGEDTAEDTTEEGNEEPETGVEIDLSGPAPPAVETVDDDSDDQKEEEEDAGDGSGDEEGTEVQLGPPPAYPVGIEPVAPPILPPAPPVGPPMGVAPVAPPMDIPKPPLTFNLPPAAPSVAPPPAAPKPAPRPVVKPKKKAFFNMGSSKKNSKKTNKAEIADATELTRFALAALEDKDVDLAAQRLEQALQVLGR